MKITVSPTEQYYRTEEGFLVRLWIGTMESSSRGEVPVSAYIAALRCDALDASDVEKALVPIPGPLATVDPVLWTQN